MLKLILDFNSALSNLPGHLPSGSIATRELDFSYNDRSYHLTAVCRGKTHRLTLRDEWGEACSGFAVVCMGHRLTPEAGEDGIDLGERSWLDLASLHLYLEGQSLGRLQIVPEMPRMTDAEKEFTLAQRHAWQFFHQMRTCPPLKVLKQGSEEAKRHLNACPTCRELLADGGGHEAWSDLAKHLASRLPSPQIPPVRPGQVWTLRDDLEGWDGNGQYLRAPQVLVLSRRRGIQVVPICPETNLAGERDVFLTDMGFAEAWNRFTLPRTSLGECWGSVEDARLQEVLRQSFQAVPEAQTDLRHAFLNLERYMADTFQKRALALALSQTRKQEKGLVLRHWYNMMETLRNLFPVPSLDNMAVAADDRRTIPLQIIENHETKCHRATLTSWITDEDGIHVSGKLLLPEGAAPSVFLAWLDRKGEDAVSTVRSELIDLYFHMDFPVIENVSENDLRLVAVVYGE